MHNFMFALTSLTQASEALFAEKVMVPHDQIEKNMRQSLGRFTTP
jgi:hypothetical protein